MSAIRSTVRLGVATVLVAGCAAAVPTPPGPSTASMSPPPEPSTTAVATSAPSPSGHIAGPSPTAQAEPPGVLTVKLPSGIRVMTLTDSVRVRSYPGLADDATILGVLSAGTRFVIVEGPVPGSGYWWYRVADLPAALDDGSRGGWLASADRDGTPWIAPTPEACREFAFVASPTSVETLADLQAGVLGTWTGCVTTPWVAPYWVTIELRADGTYSAASQPQQEGDWQPAFYYGTDADSPAKRFELDDLQDSLDGLGQIDIVFSPDSINRGDLRNVKLMGDRLEFEFFHRGEYGPLTYRLLRFVAPG